MTLNPTNFPFIPDRDPYPTSYSPNLPMNAEIRKTGRPPTNPPRRYSLWFPTIPARSRELVRCPFNRLRFLAS